MGDQILRVDSLKQPRERLLDLVENVDGFAEVFPEDKFDIVALFQAKGHITGMTGDGVNDAPALRKANVGFAVEGATPAAQGAASVILLTPGLSVIITAIKRSRKIFQRLQNYLIYRVFMSVFLLIFFFIAIAWADLNFPPVLIIFMCLILDLATMSLAYDKVYPSPKPNRWRLSRLIILASVIGLVAAAANLVFLALVINNRSGLGTVQVGMTTVCSAGMFGNTNAACSSAKSTCYPLLSNLALPSTSTKFQNAAVALLNLHPLCAVQEWATQASVNSSIYADALLSVGTANFVKNNFNSLNGPECKDHSFLLFPLGTNSVPSAFNIVEHPYTLSDFPYASAVVNTLMFLVLCMSSQFSVFSCRVDSWFFTRRPGYVLLTIISSEMFFTSIVAAFYPDFPYWDTNPGITRVRLTALKGNYIGIGWLFAFIVFAFMELGKMGTYRLMDVYDEKEIKMERMLHEQEERRRRLAEDENIRRNTIARSGTVPRSGTAARSGSTMHGSTTVHHRATLGKKKDLEQPLLGGTDADL